MKVLILAAGKGKRMKSKYPKVMHKILEKPLINWVIDTAIKLQPNKIGVVLGFGAEYVKQLLPENLEIFIQEEQLGTGHAVMTAKDFINTKDNILILYGDVPFISVDTLNKLLLKHENEGYDATLITFFLDNPSGYGRIVRDNGGRFIKIVEDADATSEQRKIKEVNSGILVIKGKVLVKVLEKIKPDNNQGEYYLTDIFEYIENKGTFLAYDPFEFSGVNNRIQLAQLEKNMRYRILEKHMLNGVTIIDPDTVYISPDVEIGRDTIIQPFTFILGKTRIGEDCEIGPFTTIRDCIIHNNVKVIRSECLKAEIKDNVSIGPYSRLREGTILETKVKIGNFVEVKKSHIMEGTKAQHLSYLGDATIEKNVNIGAGTITCNYDGIKKNPTYIGENAFIGSNSSLVAPVKIGKNTIVGAGSVITEDVPDWALALGRAKQINKENWVKEKWIERKGEGK